MTGATLVELLLVAGVIISGTAVVLAVAHNTQVQSKRSQVQKDIKDLQSRLLSGYVAQSNFSGVSTAGALADGLFPPSMLGPEGSPRTPWGGPINIAGVSSPDSSLDDSMVIAMEEVPARDCVATVSSLASGFSDILVNGVSVGAGSGLDMARLTEACHSQDNRIELWWTSPNPSEASTKWCEETYQTRTLDCPPGQLGTIHEGRLFSCPDLFSEAVPGPWTEVNNTCTPECVVPSPSVQTQERPGPSCPAGQLGEVIESRTLSYSCPAATGSPEIEYSPWTVSSNTCAPICQAPPPEPNTQTQECPPGQLGEIIEEQITTYTCPAPTGMPTSTTSPWSVISNSCAPECVLPNPSIQNDSETRTGNQTLACPPGQLGEIWQTRPETRSRSRTATCPAPTGSPSWGDWTAWSGWAGTAPWSTVTNTCADECVLPNPSTQTRAGTPASRNLTQEQTVTVYEAGSPASRTVYNCPAGRYGHRVEERPTRRSRTATQTRTQPQTRTTTQTRTASCPAPTGNHTWGNWSSPGAPYGSWTNNGSASSWSSPKAPYGSWSGYSQHGSWSNKSTHCTNCPAPVTQTQTQEAEGFRWVAVADNECRQRQQRRTRPQERTRERYYDCPAGTRTLPSRQNGPWSGWRNTAPWGSYKNTSTYRNISGNGVETEMYASCPPGWGTVSPGMRSRSWTCSGGSKSYGNWQITIYPQCCPPGPAGCQIH